MKMGTIRSPCPYDAIARHALHSVNLRRPAILRYASCTSCLPDFAGWSGYPSIAALAINPRIDVMGQVPAYDLALRFMGVVVPISQGGPVTLRQRPCRSIPEAT